MMRWLGWIALVLAIATVTHLASVHHLPHVVMNRAMARMGDVNTIHHGARASAEKQGVVRPSPDLLYSVCPFDLSKGALHVTAPVPPGTYWSVSMFDSETNNFFVLNDRQAKGSVDLLVVPKDWEKPMPGTVVHAPSTRGLVLFRTLVNDEKNLAAIDAARKQAKCGTLAHLPLAGRP
ncbi:MAG TPA: DUF1254 domain-containing protein [Rhizomicrobium sp.]|jgi:uncharacterized membrane protein